MSGNSGAWGVVMWQNNKTNIDEEGNITPDQAQGIALSGGDPIDPFLESVIVGCLLLPPDGLGVPPVRSGDVAFAQRDGVQQFGDYYEPRQLTFEVSVCNDGCPGCPTGRQKVKRLTTEWSRSCASATLVLFPDCYDPGATEEEKTYLGAYLVTGRPRVAELTWMRSNRGCARLTLRFDAQDARLILADTSPGPGNWSGTHVASAGAGAGAGGNIAQDYRHDDVVWNTQDAVAQQSTLTFGAPDGGSYRSISITTPNTVSPMSVGVGGTATNGIPVTAGNDYSFAWWARQNPVGGVLTRVDAAWWNAGGGLISTTTGAGMAATSDWSRFTQSHTAPALAAFMQPILRWSGIALAGQELATAQLWINEGAAATGPETVEVVGDLCAFPVFRLSGPLTGPIQVFYGPFSFTYDEDIAAGELVTVDTRWGRASGSGGDLTQNLLGTYDFPLSPGVHDFSFTTGDPADTGSVQIEWENAVISG
jgi:hypothetical protein